MSVLALLLLAADRATIFQTARYEELAAGRFDGRFLVADLTRHGDFGLGTFNGLDGEMVVLDGNVVRVDGFGDAGPAPVGMRTPFAFVVPFRAETTFEVAGANTMSGLRAWIDKKFRGYDGILAIRIDGRFEALRSRSFGRQMPPYRPLGQILDRQSLFSYPAVDATLVGFRMPKSVAEGNLNVPGYHFHFLTRDGKRGGHLLDFLGIRATVRVMRVGGIHLAR